MTIKNLTPHLVVIHRAGLESLTLAPEDVPARVSEEFVPGGMVNGIPVGHVRYGQVSDLPPSQDGVILVVSATVRMAASHRNDLFSPGLLVRDEQSRVIGCSSLVGRRRLPKDWPQS